MKETPVPRIVICRTCGKPVAWIPENAFRPFCSERCRNIDLGAWAAEEYRVPEQNKPLPDEQQ
ncbi:MAG: DNA gyrase inhibitor YacG [Rhodocyclaceae bacterium]|nr:DNA gyrase inhibitor YacG [Rhodocyclaceae bacterium]